MNDTENYKTDIGCSMAKC